MPLHVTIKVNDDLITDVHIGRIEGGTNPEDINRYVVVAGEEPLTIGTWLELGKQFDHRYGDGAVACVRKALEALEQDTNTNYCKISESVCGVCPMKHFCIKAGLRGASSNELL